jgi:hypothetical protein
MSYRVAVNSYAIEDYKTNGTFIVLPMMKDVNVNDLQFKEFSRHLKKVLMSKGFTPVDNVDLAKIAVLFGYTISEPQKNYNVTTIPGSSETTGTISPFGSSATINTTTTYNPPKSIVFTSTYYNRAAIIDSVDLEHYKQQNEYLSLWRVEIKSVGRSGDLRDIFPVMLFAAEPYIGKNSGKEVYINISGSDKKLKQFIEN